MTKSRSDISTPKPFPEPRPPKRSVHPKQMRVHFEGFLCLCPCSTWQAFFVLLEVYEERRRHETGSDDGKQRRPSSAPLRVRSKFLITKHFLQNAPISESAQIPENNCYNYSVRWLVQNKSTNIYTQQGLSQTDRVSGRRPALRISTPSSYSPGSALLQ